MNKISILFCLVLQSLSQFCSIDDWQLPPNNVIEAMGNIHLHVIPYIPSPDIEGKNQVLEEYLDNMTNLFTEISNIDSGVKISLEHVGLFHRWLNKPGINEELGSILRNLVKSG